MKIGILSLVLLLLVLAGCAQESPAPAEEPPFELQVFAPVPVPKTNGLKVYAHYMPWFESKDVNGAWGSHWTMATQNPDLFDEYGRRHIASHYYPDIGPYSSMDPDVIEYHLLLMKLSGIDGVLIDWYGAFDVYDYQQNRINSEALNRRIG